jgi:parallel beta-helix repeat protein
MCWDCSPTIRNCNVLNNGYHGIYAIGGQARPNVLNNIIYENDGDGVRCEPLPGEGLSAAPAIWYNNSKENNARQFGDTPAGIGELTSVNANGDSCDFQFNLIKDPIFLDFEAQDYSLSACSPCIAAGMPDPLGVVTMMGSIPYYVADSELRGNIGNRTNPITAAGNPWMVSCDAFVNPGDELTIGPGSLLLIQGVYGIRISGKIEAQGATFIPEDSTNEALDWLGIMLEAEADPTSFIRECRLVNTSTYQKTYPFGGAITIDGTAADISYNTFENCVYAAVSCQHRAEPVLSYNVIDGFGTMAINCYDNSHPDVHHNVIRNGLGYGILCEFFSSPLIQTNIIHASQHIGIKCDNFSAPDILYNTIAYNLYGGIAAQAGSNPVVRDNIVAFNGSAVTWSDTTYGNGIAVASSSFPQLGFNVFYQSEGAVFSPDMAPWPDSTNILGDPRFADAPGGDFQILPGSPALSAAEDGGEVGAYGLGEW